MCISRYHTMSLGEFLLIANLLTKCMISTSRGACNQTVPHVRDIEYKCCSGHYYDGFSNECKECPLGFTGDNCSLHCRYPSYGMLCQRECNCLKEHCNFSTGCDVGQNGEMYPETSQSNKELQITLILIGVTIALCLVLISVTARCIWKKVVDTPLATVEEDSEIRTVAVNTEMRREDNRVDHTYEDVDEQEAGKGKTRKSKKKKKKISENDYVDSLTFALNEQNADDYESKSVYDDLN